MKYFLICFLFVHLIILTSFADEKPETLRSPNGQIVVTAGLEKGRIYYSVKKGGLAILNKSFLGFRLKEGNFDSGFKILSAERSSSDESWNKPWGEELAVRDNYRQLILCLQESDGLKRKLNVVFRTYNDGFAFRYEFPEQENLKDFIIMDELTEFALAGEHTAWSIPYKTEFYEGLYKPSAISALDTVCTPLTMETKKGLYLSIHEANLTDYAGMNLFPVNKTPLLRTFLTPWSTGEKVFVSGVRHSPWRMMIIAQSPSDLLLSRMLLNLNEPSRLGDISWIKPGRYIGIWWGMHMKKHTWEAGPLHGATTENTKKYIDFAAKYGFSGVLVEGWNKGWEDWKSFEFTQPYPDFDIAEITSYAAKKNVKLIGHHETGGNTRNYEGQMDTAFAYYQKYGVDAVKTGYVGGMLDGKERHSSQYGVRHYRKVIETAALHKIMIDNHEPVMPTGLQRTFPNLMTQEGVRGQEWDAWSKDGGNPPEHTTIIPFTRGLAGPMDFTPGTFNFTNTALPGTRVHTTLAKQLALFVVLYSPLQMASDMIENYEDKPGFEFITSCPVNWAKTLIPAAKIGEYVTIARKDRTSESWFVGSITNASPRNMVLHLTFLDGNAKYKAKIFRDGKEADYKTNPYPLDIEEMEVTSESILRLHLAPGGGAAMIFTKLTADGQ
ncbi:alpha-glucosidase [Arcticibacter tournemirensis]|uniref:Glycoside hydrolase family 97 protein n=1 Tax=Arcticibacter tournemirensis TaxID=699437 RepID=A0A5M9HIH3_9SPHI|nr:glycoside hydrolase family 97 protein [Arcticibacter tournemirensis]KAA8486255.1 glycoside hydrolase family 97 protein [Arcticibacter tournemirensis]TQM52058.1 alpha-glucosidase [Arcticibacter tournemirensis]